MTDVANELLESPERRFQVLARAIPDCALYMLDPQGVIAWRNPGPERIKGYPADEIVGRHFSCFYTDADRQAGEPERGLAIAAERGKYEAEGWRVRKDGSTFWASVVIEAMRDDSGQLIGYAKITRDITPRKLAAERLLGEQAKYRAIIETAVDGITVIDERGVLQSFNHAAEKIFGYAADEVIGRNVSLLMPEPDRSRHDEYIARFRRTGEAKIIGIGREVTGRRKDGSIFPLDLSVAMWQADGQTYFTGIVRDITARKAARANLEQTLVRLHHSQKMEAVGRITGGIAHDFNNILQIIIGNIALADEHTGGNDELRRTHAAIRRATERAGRVTQQLLAFARQQPLHPEKINLSQHLRETGGLLDRTLRGNIHVEADLPADLWPVEIDTGQFDLAVLNIGVNARDAMPNGGTFRISARNATYHGLTVEQGDHGLTGRFVVVTFSDTGSGIAPDVLPHVFEPFFTTKDVGIGTGLGLSQVYGFARQSNGTATISSETGQGTTVTLFLPALGRESQADVAAPTDGAETVPSKGNVLVVEDDPDVAELTVTLLQRGGYVVRLAEHAPGALAALAAGTPVDLVFSDIILPRGMSGIALTQEIGMRYPALPVLLTTGYSDAAVDAEAHGLAILRKPYLAEALLSAVDTMLHAHGASSLQGS